MFAGNRADVTTVEAVVRDIEGKYGQAERIWVMDQGMISEANIAFLRERNAHYLVGTPKSRLRLPTGPRIVANAVPKVSP